MSKRLDLTGKRFGKWTVIKITEIKNGIVKWRCKCDCGRIGNVMCGNLCSGGSRSCFSCNRSKSKIGRLNPIWKENAGYSAIHQWVKRHKPLPKICSDCGATKNV